MRFSAITELRSGLNKDKAKIMMCSMMQHKEFPVKRMGNRPLQIYLEPAQDVALRQLARRLGVSMAEVIRRGLNLYIEEAVPPSSDPLLEVIGLGSSGRADLSENHDQLVAEEARD